VVAFYGLVVGLGQIFSRLQEGAITEAIGSDRNGVGSGPIGM
jgi:hypothetical protein